MTWGGKRTPREGKTLGRTPKMSALLEVSDKSAAGRIIEGLNRPAKEDDPYEIQQFRKIDDAGPKDSRELRMWLYDKRDGKAPQGILLDATVTIDTARRERIRGLIARLAGKAGQQ